MAIDRITRNRRILLTAMNQYTVYRDAASISITTSCVCCVCFSSLIHRWSIAHCSTYHTVRACSPRCPCSPHSGSSISSALSSQQRSVCLDTLDCNTPWAAMIGPLVRGMRSCSTRHCRSFCMLLDRNARKAAFPFWWSPYPCSLAFAAMGEYARFRYPPLSHLRCHRRCVAANARCSWQANLPQSHLHF